MADGANLDLSITSSLDESVRQSFTALVKLLKSLEKTVGGLSASVEKLAGISDKLETGMDGVTASAVKATDTLEKFTQANEEASESVVKSSKKVAKASAEQASAWSVTSKRYMTNTNLVDNYDKKLQHINKTIKQGTKEYDLQSTALAKTEESFKKHLKRIDDSVRRYETLQGEVDRMVSTQQKGVDIDTARLADLRAKLENLIPQVTNEAFFERVNAFNYEKEFQHQLEKLRPVKPVTITDRHKKDLREYGAFAVDIYENITARMEDNARQRANAFREVKQYAEWYEKELRTFNSDIKVLHDRDVTDLSREERLAHYDKIEELKLRRDAFIEEATAIGKAQRSYNKFYSSLKNETLPITKVQKYTQELTKHGDAAKSLFNYLNVGLDENSEQIKRNADAVNKYFNDAYKKQEKLQSELDVLRKKRVSASTDDEAFAIDKGITKVEKKLADLRKRVSGEGIIDGFLGFKSGRSAAYEALEAVMDKVPVFKARLEDIKNTTIQGSVEQRNALKALQRDYNEYNKILGATSKLTAISANNLEDLKRSNAAEAVIQKHRDVARELENIRRTLTDTFSGTSAIGTATNISSLMKRYSTVLTDTSPFGEKARGLFSNLDVNNLDGLEDNLRRINKQYSDVIPTLTKFAEANNLSAEQVAKLNSAEFLQQAALMKTRDGVKRLAEEYLGFHRTSRQSITLFDRMASSMGNMARYAFGASIYYAFENAIFSTIDAVAQFDQSLKNLQAITDATDKEIVALGDEIKRVAVETKYGLNEVAEGATIIGQAGYSAVETMSILGAAMNLAQGSMSTVTASADLLTTVIASFSLKASDAAMVADNMAAAMNYSKLDIDKLRTAFNYVGPVAMDAGASLQEMSAVLMVLANNGMKASTIGTSLRNVFSQLQSPSAALRKAFNAIKDGEARLVELSSKATPVVRKFEILNDVLGTNSDMFKLFGLRAAGTVSILSKYFTQIEEMQQGLYTLGEAQRMADKQMEGLANRMANFRASLEVLGVTITEQPAEGLSSLVLMLTEVVKWLTDKLDGSVGAAIATFTGFAGAIGASVIAGKLFTLMFSTTATAAIAKFGKYLLRTTASIKALTTATTASTAAQSGFLGVLFRLKASHPVAVGVLAITAAITALAGAYKLFSGKEDVVHKQLQKELKTRREQIGLLRTALSYNENITDATLRARNNAYVAQRIPGTELLLANLDKENTSKALASKLKEIEDDTVQQIADAIRRTGRRLDSLEQERKRVGALFAPVSAADLGMGEDTWNTLSIPGLYDPNTALERAAYAQPRYSEILDKIKEGEADLRGYQDFFEDVLRHRATDIAKRNPNINPLDGIDEKEAEATSKAMAEAIAQMTAELGPLSGAAKEAWENMSKLIQTEWDNITGIAIAAETADSLTQKLTTMGLEAEAIVSMYKAMGGNWLGKLSADVANAQRVIDKLEKRQFENPAEKEAARLETYEQLNAHLIKQAQDTTVARMEWAERARQHEINLVNASVMSEEQKADEIKRINTEMYAEQMDKATQYLTQQIESVVALNRLTGVDIDKTVNLIVEGNWKSLPDKLWEMILQSGAGNIITKILDIKVAQTKLESGINDDIKRGRFGVDAKNLYDSDKNEYDRMMAENERNYASGSISYNSYIKTRIAARQELIAKEEEYVATLQKTMKTASDQAKVAKAESALEENKAKAAHENFLDNQAEQLWVAEKRHNTVMEQLDKEAVALENRDMDESQRKAELLQIDRKRIQENLVYIEKQLDAGADEKKQNELLLEQQRQLLELDKNKVEQQRLAYAIRTKYIEQEYKYGLQTEQAYRDYIQKQQREGGMNPYDAQKEVWRISDSPLDGFRLGIMEISEATKTMNDYISEGVANFRDEWHSAMDEFVESWWDGTASASEIFGDFVNNIAMDWQKRILKMYSDRMFEGFARSFLGGELQGVFTQFGGGRPVVTTDDGLSDPTRTSSSWTNAIGVNTDSLALNVSASMQNMQSNLNAATNSMTADVSNMSNQSTSLLTIMTNGAASLWQFLANGFNGLWNNIGSGLSGLLASLSFATTASSGGSFFERWFGNSIGMGFQLFSMGKSGHLFNNNAKSVLGGPLPSGTDVVSGLGFNAFGNVFKGLSGFSNSIVASPTLFTYGEHLKAFAKGAGVMGEAGPEAIMPLTRDGSGRLGVNASGMSPCINNIYIETPEGYTAEQTSRMANDNGGEDIMFTIVKQTAANVAQPGSPMYRAMQNTFGASQVLTSR